MSEILTTHKEVGAAFNRSRSFGIDLCRAGLRLPATREQAFKIWQRCPHPSTTRPNYSRRRCG